MSELDKSDKFTVSVPENFYPRYEQFMKERGVKVKEIRPSVYATSTNIGEQVVPVILGAHTLFLEEGMPLIDFVNVHVQFLLECEKSMQFMMEMAERSKEESEKNKSGIVVPGPGFDPNAQGGPGKPN